MGIDKVGIDEVGRYRSKCSQKSLGMVVILLPIYGNGLL